MDESSEPTAYDLFLGIFTSFPKKQNVIYGFLEEIKEFLLGESMNYPSLKRFTRSELDNGLAALFSSKTLCLDNDNPRRKYIDLNVADYAFEQYHKKELFGEEGMRDIKELSIKFLERFA